jgi:Leucine-rich repeat (LRR) protein
MKTLFTFFLIFVFCLNAAITTKAQVNVSDSLALVDLYNSTNGPGWKYNRGWLTTDPVSTWVFITVTGTRVTQIWLQGNNLTGTIPSSIGNLVNLQSLQLNENQLSGSIPSSIGNLVNLQTLYLPVNQLSGSIPSSIGNLVQLDQLLLSNNRLSGSIPSSIGNLVNLHYLYLSENQLSGEIPASISNLVNLGGLKLSENQLSGEIPTSIGNLVHLAYLELFGNQLSGEIPTSIGNIVYLKNLSLFYNQLSGKIPTSIGNLVHLNGLELDHNQLSGEIPTSIGNLVQLQYLALNNNKLSGKIPTSIGNLVNLEYLYSNQNRLSGSIPSSIGKLVHVTDIDLGHNRLSGSIPSSIGNLVHLNYLKLNHNQLSGEVPLPENKIKYLNWVDISYNQLTQNANIEFSSSIFRRGKVNNNHFTFNGIEYIAQKFPKVVYAPQAIIPLHQHGNTLSLYAGGTLVNNTYHWFRMGSTDSIVINGDSTFQPKQTGKYYVRVTNAVATQLTLYSDTVDFTINNLIASNSLPTDANSSKPKQGLQVYPNPANSIAQVQVNGTATITLTNSAGKIMLAKTISNNAFINVKSFAPGTYYIQNKDNGEVKKIVVTH